MEKQACVCCQNSKANLKCVSCEGSLCKSCAQFVDKNSFQLMKGMPEGLTAGAYCIQCYDTTAQPQVALYEAKIEQAKNIAVFTKDQGKEVTSYKTAQFPVEVEPCEDRQEALLRLAFMALEQGYDTLIRVEILPKKLRNGSYLKTLWTGQGVPAMKRERQK